MVDALILFCEQSRTPRMALALSQSLLCPFNLPRKLLPPKAHRGVAIGILIELPRVIFGASMQRLQHCSEHACMSHDRDTAVRGLCLQRKKLHFVQHPPLKIMEAFTIRCWQAGILRNPATTIDIISSFNLFPCDPFPPAKANLAQRGTHMAVDTKHLSDRHSRRMGTAQVTGINHSDLFHAKPVD